jgi:hypothetical protein
MPYPNEHSARLKTPGQYDEFRRQNNKFGSGVHAIFGIKKGPPRKSELQAIRFDAKKFTVKEAKKWLKDNDHKPILFEPATGEKKMPDDLKDVVLSKACPEPELEFLEGKKDDGTEHGQITGFAAVFNNTDLQGDVIRPGAFTKTIKERVSAGKVVLMTRHFAFGGDTSEAIGVLDSAEETKRGLKISAKLFGDDHAQATREKLKAAPNAWGMSVGFKTIRSADHRDKDGTLIGKELLEVALYEVTLTLVPANEKTTASAKSESEIDELRQRVEALEQKASAPTEPKRTEVPVAPRRTSALLKRRLSLLKTRR